VVSLATVEHLDREEQMENEVDRENQEKKDKR
jgi:hypothetical protein